MKRYIQTGWISFFIFLFFVQCRTAEAPPSVSIITKNDKAVGLLIRGVQIEKNDLSRRLEIQLVQPNDRARVLGEFKFDRDEVIFEPLVPFTYGLRYEVLLDDSLLAEVEIPKGEFVNPELLSIYPTQDTLPENLLKMYIHFSQPMVEGRSLSNIRLIGNRRDTMKGTFLDLKPELWNAEGTVLTLWLDPGRIKRDLIPNKELGTPLQEQQEYTLYVANSWNSKNGLPLVRSYSKTFRTTSRDNDSPDPTRWTIVAPLSGTKQPLEIELHETLDYYLLNEGITVANSNGDLVSGVVQVNNEEKTFKFHPDNPWDRGDYTIQVESRLEDLAGNNLNRPFDREVKDTLSKKDLEIFAKKFKVQ